MSSVGYNINTTGNIDSAGTSIANTDNQYIGSGGINQLHFGLAYNIPHTRLVLGANLSFLFGYLNYQQNIIYPDNIAAYNSQVTENTNIHGFTGDYGFMWTICKSRDSGWQAVVGGTLSMGSSLFANYNLLAINYLVASPQSNVDTIVDSSASGRIKLPMTYGVGLTIIKRDKNNNDAFTFTFDYSMQRWSQYSVLGEAQNLNNTNQYNVGFQYIPAKNGTFFKRIHYRIGYSQTQTYLNQGTPIMDRCGTIGVAIPVGPPFAPPISNQLGILNIGFQVGVLGTTTNNELQEEYAKILVAFTFNSKWFQKHLYQ